MSKAASFLSLGGSASVGAAHHAVEAAEIVDLMAKIMKVCMWEVVPSFVPGLGKGGGGEEGAAHRAAEVGEIVDLMAYGQDHEGSFVRERGGEGAGVCFSRGGGARRDQGLVEKSEGGRTREGER